MALTSGVSFSGEKITGAACGWNVEHRGSVAVTAQRAKRASGMGGLAAAVATAAGTDSIPADASESPRDASSARPRIPLFELLVLALGFGLCRVWVVSTMAFAGGFELAGGGAFQLDQIYLLAGAAATCVAALLGTRLFDSPQGLARLNYASLGLVVLSLAAMALAGALAAAPAQVAAFALAGAASGILQVLWGERFVRHSMRLALLAAPAAAIVTALVMMALPDAAVEACVYVAPLLSIALLCTNRGEAGSLVLSLRPQPADAAVLASVPGEAGNPVASTTLVRLMASIAVFSLIGRCLDSFPAGVDASTPAFFEANYMFLAILAVGVLFMALVLVLGKRFDTMMVYRLSLPLMVAGFVILTLFMDRFTLESIFVITAGYEFFDVLFWAMLVGVVRTGGRRPVATFGWGVACTYAGMAFGTMISRATAARLLSGELDISAFSMVSILALVLLVVLVLPEGTLSKVGASRSGARGAGAGRAGEGDGGLAVRCEAVARRYDLTPRERDVFVLIARGRTLGVISRELNIAEGTARTHMGHIYAKLGVHRQQELIDLVEAEPLPEEE
ncbi:MAG: hypothetical protein KHY83_04285 [Coriobacteriia bacterium]|nr:hypothetical protein [Coriobacteriia bacterium]